MTTRTKKPARRAPEKPRAVKKRLSKNKSRGESQTVWYQDGRTKTVEWTTSVTPLGKGRYGVRLLCDGKVVQEDNSATSRLEAAHNLKSMLRMANKCGWGGRMADASRDRFFCAPESVKKNPIR